VHTRALLVMAGLVAGGAAAAQPVPMMPDAYWGGLKQHMHIRPGQEGAWKNYSAAMGRMEAKAGFPDKTMMDAMRTATWHERCQMMNRSIRAAHAADAARKAAAALAPALDKAQRAEAPAELPGFSLPPGPGLG
jgi:hypothetical protein